MDTLMDDFDSPKRGPELETKYMLTPKGSAAVENTP